MGLLGAEKGWGCCKSRPNAGTPSKSHPWCSTPSLWMRGHPLVLLLLPRGTFSRLEAAWATLSALELSWAWCPGRKGGSWAGQDAVLRPAKEVVFPAECNGASSSPWWDCSFLALLSPGPTWHGDKDGAISLHVSCPLWMVPTVLYQLDFFFPCSLLGPWESIPAFNNITLSLAAKYYSQPISVYPGSCHPHRDT